jgi:hypothetical protein
MSALSTDLYSVAAATDMSVVLQHCISYQAYEAWNKVILL